MLNQSINQVRETLEKLYRAEVSTPLFIWGSPGIGKSAAVKEASQNLGIDLIIFNLAQRVPGDLLGLPFTEEDPQYGKVTGNAPPKGFPKSGKGILFFDEINMASPILMGIAQRLFLDRQIGDYIIPDGWMVVCAGNRASDRAAVSKIPSPVANRLIHTTVEPSYDEWKDRALSKGLDGTPLQEEVLGYLNFSTHNFFKPSSETKDMAFPTPRSWSVANKLHSQGMTDMIPGVVGTGVGGEFLSFLEISSKLPNIQKILEGEKVKPLSKSAKPAIFYAAMSSLAIRTMNADPKDVINYAENALVWIASNNKLDISVVFANDVLKNEKFKPYLADFAMKVLRKNPEIQKMLKELEAVIA